MTNKEKSRELAIKSTADIDDKGNEVYNVLVEAALQEMAAWKEQQMIQRAVEWFAKNWTMYTYPSYIMFEDFKKAMKGE